MDGARGLLRQIAAGGLLVLAGCATYPTRLPDTAPLTAVNLQDLEAQVGLETRQQVTHRFDPSDGLDLTEVAILAVLNNPRLKAERRRLQVAQAQAFAAGLLPDPRLSASLDRPSGEGPGFTEGFSLGFAYDLGPLVTRGARLDAARGERRQVRLDILWQEWLTIQRARTLALRSLFLQQRLDLLQQMQVLYQNRYARSTRALDQGDVTLGASGADLTALLDVFTQIHQLEQSSSETRHALTLLLGLPPDTALPLVSPPALAPMDTTRAHSLLASLANRRPDLLALKAGFAAQEARVRGAILAQFPALSVGVTRARDTSSDDTVGFGIGLTLPLFSGSRGDIDLAQATRSQLRAEYASRLAQAASDVDRLLTRQQILLAQQSRLETYLPRLAEMVAQAGRTYESRDIDALTFLNMEATWTGERLEEIALSQTLWENRIALNALLATPEGTVPTLTLPGEATAAQRR